MLKFLKGLLKKKQYGYYRSMWNDETLIRFTAGDFLKETPAKEDKRTDKKPIEVWNTLITEQPKIDLTDIDFKIKQVEERIKVLKEVLGNDKPNEEYEVLGYLNARKKYDKFKDQLKYPITTDEMVKTLCTTHKLKMAPVAQFYTTMPREAIEELAKYLEVVQKIRKEQPEVKLIVEDKNVEVEKKRRDPILLVGSPFGRWYYILGAWDKEVEIVDELIYRGK